MLLLIASTGCGAIKSVVLVDKPPARVSMKAVPLDLVYGMDPVSQRLPAPTLGYETIGEFGFEELFGGQTFAPAPYTDPCPEPGADVFPEEPVATDVTAMITPGRYLFKSSGTIEFVGLAKVGVDGLTYRHIKNVQPLASGGFTFDLDLVISLRFQTQTFDVVPGDGIYLRRIVTRVNTVERVFEPLLPVEVFPLPVTLGPSSPVPQPFTGVGADPISGEVLTVEARLIGKERLEGCGEVFEAWVVDASWTFQRPGSAPTVWNYDYWVAPQLGGVLGADHIRTTEVFAPLVVNIDAKSILARIRPQDVIN